MRRTLLMLTTLLLISGTASACLNDSGLPDREREFRQQYLSQPQRYTDSRRETSRSGLRNASLKITGSTLLIAGLIIVLRRSQRSE